jgi:hypothetical protein
MTVAAQDDELHLSLRHRCVQPKQSSGGVRDCHAEFTMSDEEVLLLHFFQGLGSPTRNDSGPWLRVAFNLSKQYLAKGVGRLSL